METSVARALMAVGLALALLAPMAAADDGGEDPEPVRQGECGLPQVAGVGPDGEIWVCVNGEQQPIGCILGLICP